MAVPAIVQSAFARTNSASTTTLTLGAAPTPGNLLVCVIQGYGVSTDLGVPAGFTRLAHYWTGNEGNWVNARTVVSGDAAAWPILVSGSNWSNVALFEISNPAGAVVSTNQGACSGSGSTAIATGALIAGYAGANALRLVGIEWDNVASITAVPADWTLVSPASWQNTGSGAAHNAGIWTASGADSGTQPLTASAALTTPIWLDLVIVAPPDLVVTKANAYAVVGAPNLAVRKANAYAVLNVSPVVRVTQLGSEAWLTNPSPPLQVTQAGSEVWLDISKPYVAPTAGYVAMCIIT